MSEKCEWLHNVLSVLPIVRYPFDLTTLPDNGVYFLYETGETWGHSNDQMLRIVRVGTHREGNFKSRISEHFLLNESKMNFDKNQSAPHERSIFRKNLGRAILNKQKNPYLKVWEIDFTSKNNRDKYSHLRDIEMERKIEFEISDYMRKYFTFRYVVVEEQEKRMGSKGIESKLIGTLSQCQLCKASSNWLGKYSPKKQIVESGLWLSQHLKSPSIDETDKKFILNCLGNMYG